MSKDGSGNLLGPSLTLDIDCVLDDFDKNERDQEFKQVTFVMLRNVSILRRIYTFYTAMGHSRARVGAAAVMTKLQFWRFLKDCQIHHHNLSLSSMDRIVAGSKDIQDIHNPMEKILLRDFHSNCVILSYFIYRKKDKSSGKRTGLIARCLQRLIDEHIAKFSGQVHGQFLTEPRRAMSALAYMERSWKIYQQICTQRRQAPYENSFCMRQFLFLLKDLKIVGPRLSTKDVLNILSSDDPSVSDGDNYNLELEMTFLEFFEALIGIALKFKSSDYPPTEHSLNSSRSQKARNRVTHQSEMPLPSVHQSTMSNQSIKEKTEAIKTKLSDSVSKLEDSREDELTTWCLKLNKFFTQFFFPAWNHAETLRNKVAKDKAEKELKQLLNKDTESETSDSPEQVARLFVSYSDEKSPVSSYEPSVFTESEFGTFASSTPGLSRVSSSIGSGVSSSVSRRTNNEPT